MSEMADMRREGVNLDVIASHFKITKAKAIKELRAELGKDYDAIANEKRKRKDRLKANRNVRGVTEKQATEILELRRLRYSYQDIAHQVKTSKANAIAVVHRDMPKSERDEIDDEVHRRRAEGLKHGYREGEINGCAKRWARQWVALPVWEA